MNHPQKPQRHLSYHGILLGLFSLIAGGLLAWGYISTKEDIATRANEDLQSSLDQVIPTQLYDNSPATDTVTLKRSDGTPVTVYRARLKSEITAVAFEVSQPGYSGVIKLILGLDRDGKVLGVRVVKHTETPGLGDKMELSKGKWILDFDNLSLGNPPIEQWKVKKDGGRFDQFTGATITPRAVVRAIREGLEFYSVEREHIIAAAAVN
jgi:electron transport complex protein RnfG